MIASRAFLMNEPLSNLDSKLRVKCVPSLHACPTGSGHDVYLSTTS